MYFSNNFDLTIFFEVLYFSFWICFYRIHVDHLNIKTTNYAIFRLLYFTWRTKFANIPYLFLFYTIIPFSKKKTNWFTPLNLVFICISTIQYISVLITSLYYSYPSYVHYTILPLLFHFPVKLPWFLIIIISTSIDLHLPNKNQAIRLIWY